MTIFTVINLLLLFFLTGCIAAAEEMNVFLTVGRLQGGYFQLCFPFRNECLKNRSAKIFV